MSETLDFSEINEAAALFDEIMAPAAGRAQASQAGGPPAPAAAPAPAPATAQPPAAVPAAPTPQAAPAAPTPQAAPAAPMPQAAPAAPTPQAAPVAPTPQAAPAAPTPQAAPVAPTPQAAPAASTPQAAPPAQTAPQPPTPAAAAPPAEIAPPSAPPAGESSEPFFAPPDAGDETADETKSEPDVKPAADAGAIVYRSDRLEQALENMCKRGDFNGAVLADNSGFPLALINPPVEGDLMAAFTTILGESMGRAASLLERPAANNISMDIDIVDKVVLRKFNLRDKDYYLMIICAQEIDERSEVELTIDQIINILT